MSIIKFRDTIHPSDESFNIALKGKYAYWVLMKWAIPLDSISYNQYVRLVRNGCDPDPSEYNVWLTDSLTEYIDFTATEKLVNIQSLLRSNEVNTTGSDLTSSQVLNARDGIIKEILNSVSISEPLVKRALEYILDPSKDDILPTLQRISQLPTTIPYHLRTTPSGTGCLPCDATPTRSIFPIGGSGCDIVKEYQSGLRTVLQIWFSDPQTWLDTFDDTLLKRIRQYITGILKMELGDYSSFQVPLKQFHTVLNYIIDRDLVGHKNAIRDSLSIFSDLLLKAKFR